MNRTSLDVSDGIAWITLDDGKVNAMSAEMLAEIDSRLDSAEAAAAVTVIRGRAGVFSAGFDMATVGKGAGPAIEMVHAGARLLERLLAFPLPVVTACSGHAYPMGAFLMLAADSRFGVEGPYRIGMNETAIGLTVPRFALALARARLTAPGFARIVTAALFAPDEARHLGYLDHVVPPEELDTRVRAEAERLRALDAASFAETKARANAPVVADLRAAIDEELASAA